MQTSLVQNGLLKLRNRLSCDESGMLVSIWLQVSMLMKALDSLKTQMETTVVQEL